MYKLNVNKEELGMEEGFKMLKQGFGLTKDCFKNRKILKHIVKQEPQKYCWFWGVNNQTKGKLYKVYFKKQQYMPNHVSKIMLVKEKSKFYWAIENTQKFTNRLVSEGMSTKQECIDALHSVNLEFNPSEDVVENFHNLKGQ